MNLKQLFLNNVLMFVVLMTAGVLLSVFLKNDFCWDFANYHYYNAWAFLNNRTDIDIAPASLHSFFNPLIEIPLYFYIQYFNDNISLIYAFQGIWCGLLLFTFYKIYTIFFDTSTWDQKVFCIFALIISMTGYATYHQIGASTNEIPIAFFILWGLYILLKMIKFPEKQTLKRFLFAGLIMGIGLGLKQTVVTYCVASGITLMICHKYLNKPFKSIFCFALGGLIGYLIINGYFMYKYWILYQNPFFPFLNGIFKSPYFDDFNFKDVRFVPSLNLFFIYPFLWNFSKYNIAEVEFFDLRLTLLYILILCFIFKLTMKKINKSEKNVIFLNCFLVLSFFLWLSLFSILRYTVVLEICSVLLFIGIAKKIWESNLPVILQGLFISFIVIIAIIPVLGNGWEKKGANEKYIEMEQINLPENTLLKLYNHPTAFIVPQLIKNKSGKAFGYMQYNCLYMKGSDFLERGTFRKIRNEQENKHTGPVVIAYLDNTLMPNMPMKQKKKLAQNCLKENECNLSVCQTSDKIREIILSIPDNYFCRPLKNNVEKRISICVPKKLKTQILGEEND